ncbi:hypothetical protein ACOSP6_13005 [Tenacibaculum sp. MEBiC06402]|uniref:hypothetical protein n=1 Tax=unclassified Tenacibaculum TaxID=2635139 RepID=UPI003B9A0788
MSLEKKPWSNFNKIGLRFSFIYFILYIALNNNGAYPYLTYLTYVLKIQSGILYNLIPWFGNDLLGVDYTITTGPNGSGDTTYHYLLVLFMFIVSVFGTIVWSLLDRKRKTYSVQYYWLTTAIRYYVGIMLYMYGLIKVIKSQFPEPSFYRLTETYGESSPMGLAWTFLGFSVGYNLFIGLAEMAAILLIFRKTYKFAAVLTLVTTANVMAVNYFFDIPVKLLSTHLFLMTLFLLLIDAKKLFLLFFKGASVQLTKIEPAKFSKKWLRPTLRVTWLILVGYWTIFAFYNVIQRSKTRAKKPPMYGYYKVQDFTMNKDTLPPLENDTVRWKSIRIERPNSLVIKTMDGKSTRYNSKTDTIKKSIELVKSKDSTQKFILNYKKLDSLYYMNTVKGGDTINIKFNRLTKKDFLLMNRGFNWINERPFNK